MTPRAALALLWLGAAGCASVSSMQTASTLGKGNFQGGVEGTVIGISAAGAAGQLIPTVGGFFRFGLADRVDLGFRGGAPFLEVHGKFMFTSPEARLAISMAPALSGYYLWATTGGPSGVSTPATGRLSLAVPLLVGIKLGDHELVFEARATNHALFLRRVGSPQLLNTAYQLGVGGGAAFAIRLGASFVLMPAAALELPVFTTNPAVSSQGFITTFGPGSMNLTVGVAAIFGRMRPRQDAPPPPEPGHWEDPGPLPPDVAPPPPPPPPPAAN